MTRTGIVFSILNVFVTLLFLLTAAPVVNNRLQKRQAIDDVYKNKIPGLQKQIAEQDVRRVEIPREINDVLAQSAFERSVGDNQKSLFEARLSILADAIANFNSRIRTTTSALEDIRAEVTARQNEVNQMNQLLADGNRQTEKRNQEIADLKGRIDATQKIIDESNQKIAEFANRIAEIEKQKKTASLEASGQLADR